MLEKKISQLIAAGLLLGSANCGIAVIDYEPQQSDAEDAGSKVDLPDASPDASNSCDIGLPDGYDLKNYPNMFVNFVDGKYVFNGYFVVGENAAAIDNLSMTDIAASMKYQDSNGNYSQPVFISDATKLDSEIKKVYAQNILSVGNACDNQVTAELQCNPADCLEGLAQYQARIKLITQDNNNVAMLVVGYSGNETRSAAKVIAHRPGDLSGKEVLVEGTDYQTAKITVIKE